MGDTEDSTEEVEDGEMDIVATDSIVGQGNISEFEVFRFKT